MNDEGESDSYLFHTAVAVMVVVMAIMIDKLGTGVAAAFRHAPAHAIDTQLLPAVLIEATIFLTSICVLATLIHLHRGAGLRYRRHYFFMDVLAGAFLLLVSFSCVHESTFNHLEDGHGPAQMDGELIGKGLVVLAGTFFVLVIRALMAYSSIPRADQRRKVLWVVPFHVSGIGLAVVATARPELLLGFAVVGSAGAMLYLALFWALRLQISVVP